MSVGTARGRVFVRLTRDNGGISFNETLQKAG